MSFLYCFIRNGKEQKTLAMGTREICREKKGDCLGSEDITTAKTYRTDLKSKNAATDNMIRAHHDQVLI